MDNSPEMIMINDELSNDNEKMTLVLRMMMLTTHLKSLNQSYCEVLILVDSLLVILLRSQQSDCKMFNVTILLRFTIFLRPPLQPSPPSASTHT